jgi:hypothetical protein
MATASSGLPVNFISNSPSVCTLVGSAVTLVGVGGCSITATQGGNAKYAAALPVTQTFTVKYSQTITFGRLKNEILDSRVPFQITATASSGLPVTFISQTSQTCQVSGDLITTISPGTCSISALQSGNATYGAALPVTQNFTIVMRTLPTRTGPPRPHAIAR